tara:strand:+ start:3369 stop:3791 length:423 start_codon:yes stop_codon:yes gene_type:complete
MFKITGYFIFLYYLLFESLEKSNMADLEVLYNSDCPVCDREIRHYKKLAKNDITFTPITPETAELWNLTEDQAAKKLHAKLDGKQINGVDAFQEIWNKLPYYRFLSKVIGIWPIKSISNLIYLGLLAPLLFKFHKYRNKV